MIIRSVARNEMKPEDFNMFKQAGVRQVEPCDISIF